MIWLRVVLGLWLLLNLAEAHADVLLLQYDAQRNLTQRSMSEDQYVAGVLEAEMGTSFHDEALKAQAVVSRTWYRLNAKRHRGKAVCALTHCQVWRPPSERALKLARWTHGFYLKNVSEVFFASSCARRLEQLPDGSYRCEISPAYHWKLRIPAAVFSKFFEKQLPWDFQLSTNEDSILINTQREILKLRKDVFFEKSVSILGNQVVRSPFFRAVRKEDHVELIGMGLGHGRGFCQWGAQYRAQQGIGFREILKVYFPNAMLVQDSRDSRMVDLAKGITLMLDPETFSVASYGLPKEFYGFFITFKSAQGKTLGCSGEITNLQSINSIQLRHHLVRAIQTDPRYPRPSDRQVQNSIVYLSLVTGVFPLKSIYESNPKNSGYLYEAEGRQSVLLPGEAKTARWALLELRRQAGFHEKPAYGESLRRITAQLWTFPFAKPEQIQSRK
jgi:stage II sporulation protein D